jgi:hypothetical protein
MVTAKPAPQYGSEMCGLSEEDKREQKHLEYSICDHY